MSKYCLICQDYYYIDINPPYKCLPCGHIFCKLCLDKWFNLESKSCPICNIKINDISSCQKSRQNNEKRCNIIKTSNNNQEIISNRLTQAIYLIDNSINMKTTSNEKTFRLSQSGKIIEYINDNKWFVIKEKILQIANYNIKRNLPSIYYLINPYSEDEWHHELDYLIIDPTREDFGFYLLDILEQDLLDISKLRGKFNVEKILLSFRQNYNFKGITCLNILTNQLPDKPLLFKRELLSLNEKANFLFVFNISESQNRVEDYYTSLKFRSNNKFVNNNSVTICNYREEANKIWNCGNSFFSYTYNIHLSRMAGCNSILSNWLSKVEFYPFYVSKLLTQISSHPFSLTDNLTNEILSSVDIVNRENLLVYDIRWNSLANTINRQRLKMLYFRYPIRKRLGIVKNTFLIDYLFIIFILLFLRFLNWLFNIFF